MNEERLRAILRRGDGEEANPIGNSTEFTERVRLVAAGRKRARRVAGGLLLVTAAAAGWWSVTVFLPRHAMEPTVVTTRESRPEVEVVREAPTKVDDLEVLDPVWQARDEAACTMVFMAGRREARVGKEETKQQYERVIALFPDTHWAEVAKKETLRLAKQD